MKTLVMKHVDKIVYIITILVYILARVVNAEYIIEPKLYLDSEVYLSTAAASVFSSKFWLSRVPVVVPLFYRLVGQEVDAIVQLQQWLSILAWVLLGFATATYFRGRLLKCVAFVSILFFGLSGEVLLFQFLILSESISLSILLIHIALWLFFLSGKMKSWPLAGILMLTGILWVFTRDTNSLLMLGTAGLIMLGALIFRLDVKLKVSNVILIVGCFLSSQLGSASERWLPPNLKVIEQRILTDPENLAFYVDHGMPVNETLLSFAGRKDGRIGDWYRTPELVEFMEWHAKYGKKVYLNYLLRDPVAFFWEPIEQARFLVNAGPIFYYAPRGFVNPLPGQLGDFVFFQYWTPLIIFMTIGSFIAGTVVLWVSRREALIVPLSLILLLYPHALIVWTGSGGDISRHSYQFRVQYRLAIWLLFIYLLGALIEFIYRRYSGWLEKGKWIFVSLGVFLVVFGLTADFFFSTGEVYKLGFAQIGLLVMGSGLAVLGLGFHFAPEWIRVAVLGPQAGE